MEKKTTASAQWAELAYRTPISMGGHTVMADEPESLGGGDTGPTPFDLVAGALAACTAITLRMYSQRKNWPLENVVVQCELWQEAPVSEFRRTISIVGSLTDEQRQRLLQVANACPTHKLLASGANIITTEID